MTTYETTLNAFIDSNEFEQAVMDSTTAGFGGSGYSVELFEDGTWRVLWDNMIGNLYDSPGIILSIPQLGEDEDFDYVIVDLGESMRIRLAEKLDKRGGVSNAKRNVGAGELSASGTDHRPDQSAPA